MGEYFFGIYDYILGMYLVRQGRHTIRLVDEMNMKHRPERVIGDIADTVYTLNQFIERIILKMEGFTNIKQYND